MDRLVCLERWRANSAGGTPIVGAGAGTGISAKCAEAAGADLIIVYNSGRYRMAGRGSLAGPHALWGRERHRHGDGTRSTAHRSQDTSAGRRLWNRSLSRHGSISSPPETTRLFRSAEFPDGGADRWRFRESLEETGMGYVQEVEMIARAHDLDLLTCAYVFNEDEAKAMAKAGADLLIAHMGLTTKGTIGAKTAITLDQSVDRIQAIQEAAISIHPEILVLCHGGPIAEPDDVQYILSRTHGVCGFFGASSIERLPTERAITEQVRNFKSLNIHTDHS